MLAAEAAMYRTRGEFRKNSNSAYLIAGRRGILDSICKHMEAQRAYRSDDELAVEAAKYRTKTAFRKGSPAAYSVAHKRGIIDSICEHMDSVLTYWSDEMLAAEALEHNSRIDFYRSNRAAYAAARKRGLLDQICNHMEESSGSDYDAVYIWKVLNRAWYKIGLTSQRLGCLRINEVSRSSGFKVEWLEIYEVPAGTARSHESAMKSIGDLIEFAETFDGYTEFRSLTDEQLETVRSIASPSAKAKKHLAIAL